MATTLQNAATANGNGSTLDVSAATTANLVVSGLGSAIVNFEASADGGASYGPINGTLQGVNPAPSSNRATQNGTYRFDVTAYGLMRARISDYVSGTITVVGTAASTGGGAVTGTVGIDQTTPGTTNRVDTELPAARASADSLSNPTAPDVLSQLHGYDGGAGTWQRLRVPTKFVDLGDPGISINTIATVWAPAAGKKVRIMGGEISVSAAGRVLFEDGAAGAGNFVFRTPKLAADTPYSFVLGNGRLLAAADNILKATLAGATITGTIYGVEE